MRCINIIFREIFSIPFVHRVRDIRLFDENKLLIKKGLSPSLKSIAAISYEKCVFKDSLTAIKVCKQADITDLKIFCGLLQSDLFSYFIIQTGSSTGIEREQGHNPDKFNFPHVKNQDVADCVEQIEALSKKFFKETNPFSQAQARHGIRFFVRFSGGSSGIFSNFP